MNFLRRLIIRPGARGGFYGAGALALLGVLLAGVVERDRLLSPFSPSTVAVAEVTRGRFVREVTATGILKAVKATPIVVPVDIQQMQKVAWLAKDGAAVKAGEPVVLFDPTDMEKDLRDGKADRESSQNKIEKTAAANRRTATGLSLDRDISRQELADAEKAAAKDPNLFPRNEIIESEIDRGLFQKRSEAAEGKLSTSARLGAAELSLNEIERSKADILIRQAERGLSSLRVLAPHDGLLVLERNWRGQTLNVGEPVWPGQKIAEIPDLSALEVKVYVLESDAGGLEVGRAAKVSIEGRPGPEYRAKVSRVDVVAKPREWRSPIKYFETILTLERMDPATMKPGQNVRARIVLEDIPGIITIPRGAIFEKDGKRVAYRLEGGRFSPVEVAIGHNSLSRVVIEKGLQPGDRIALRDPTRPASEVLSSPGSAGGKGAAAAPGERAK